MIWLSLVGILIMFIGLASNDDALAFFGWISMGIFYLLNYFNEKQERKNATERKRQEQAHQAQSRQRQERLESERLERERLERERLERERLERERLERERREREHRDREQRIENWIKAAQKSAQELALKHSLLVSCRIKVPALAFRQV